MKVIFLDFDGVITIPPKWRINPNKIKWIKKIVDETNAKIVVSSSWRSNNIENTIKSLKDEFNNNIINENVKWFINNLYDVTPWVGLGGGRGGEIQKWLNDHPEVDNYVIIDDDADMWDSQLYHFVQTNYEHGIGESEAIYAIKILNKLYIHNALGLNFTLRNEWLNKCHGLSNRSEELYDKYCDLKQDFKNRYEN